MNSKTIILSSAGIKNIIEEEREFTFIFGEQEVPMKNIYSEFISPIVSHIHHSDPTIDRFQFTTKTNISKFINDDFFKEDIVELFKEISQGNKIHINEDQINNMRIISIFIGNDELFSQLNELQPIDQTDIDKLLEFIEIIEITKFQFSYEFDGLFDSISSNFSQINKEKIKTLPTKIVFKILSNDHLKIETEDSLFDFINEFFENKETESEETEEIDETTPQKVHFYELVDIKKLSEEKFVSFLHKIDRNDITGNLWNNLLDRFIQHQGGGEEKTNTNRYSAPLVKQFLFDGQKENELSGIIRFLTNESGGNVHDKGCVSVTGSSECSSSCLAKFAVDFDNKATRFRSNSEANSWLRYDFKERKVRPTHYSITSKPCGQGDYHPQHWVIEGSNTGENDWKILDTRNGITVLNAKSVTHTFDIQEKLKPDEFFRFLRIRQTGKNAAGTDYLGLSALEYFGSLI